LRLICPRSRTKTVHRSQAQRRKLQAISVRPQTRARRLLMVVTSQISGRQDSVVLQRMRPGNPDLQPMQRPRTPAQRLTNRDGAVPRPIRPDALDLQPMQRQLTPAHRTTDRDGAVPRRMRPDVLDPPPIQRQPILAHRSASRRSKVRQPTHLDEPAPQPMQPMTIARLPGARDDGAPQTTRRVDLERRPTPAQRTPPTMVSPTAPGPDLREALAPMELSSSVTRVAAPRL
jgi:hypothetical protein